MNVTINSASEASERPPAYAWFVLTIFFAAAVLSYTDRLILNLFVDPIRHDLNITDTQVSYLQGATFAVIYALVGLPLGRFADRNNRRNIVVAGIALWSVATAACGFARDFGHFFAARLFVGIGEATLAPAVMSMIPDFFPAARRGTAIGIFLAGMTIGGGVAVAFGGVLLGAFTDGTFHFVPVLGRMEPWRAVLVFLALPGLIIAALMLAVREPLRRDQASAAASRFGATVSYFFQHRWMFAAIFGAFALLQLVDYGFNAWLPTLLIRRFHMMAAVAGTRIGAISILFGGVGTLLGGLLADRLLASGRSDARLRVTIFAFLVALPVFAFPLMPSGAGVLGLYAAYALIAAMGSSAGLTAIQDAVPAEMRGVSVSLQAFAYTLFGLGAGPTVVAVTTEYFFRDPAQVGFAMVTVALPAGVTALILLVVGLKPYRNVRKLLAERVQ